MGVNVNKGRRGQFGIHGRAYLIGRKHVLEQYTRAGGRVNRVWLNDRLSETESSEFRVRLSLER